MTSPAQGAAVPNPSGSVTVSGTSQSSAAPVTTVDIYLQADGSAGPWWDSASGTWVAAPYPNAATITDAHGDWTFTAAGQAAGGGLEVFASAVNSSGLEDISAEQSAPSPARDNFTLLPSSGAVLQSSAGAVAPGGSITLSGSGFGDSEQVSVSLGGSALTTITSGGSGALPATKVTVPTNDEFGPETLVATGESSGRSTTAELYVANSWSQYLDGATHPATEPNDDIFAPRVSVGPNSYLTESWSFASGAPVEGSPSFVDGVVYFGTGAGVVEAVNVRSGMEVWSYQDAAGAAINSSPAIVGNTLIVGTGAGSVIALDTSTGALIWTSDLKSGAISSSPSVAGSTAYVGTKDGHVYALSISTGTTQWAAQLPGGISASPAVDSAKSLVVVGDHSDLISALSTTSGAKKWSVATGGPVTASALISGGSVYVGSGDDKFYKISETTGAVGWTVATGGPITASASTFRSDLLVGSGDGYLYRLSPAGQVLYRSGTGAPIVGVASTLGFVVVETSTGSVQAIKPESDVGSVWTDADGSALASTPTIADGEILITSENGTLSCFTIPGRPPV